MRPLTTILIKRMDTMLDGMTNNQILAEAIKITDKARVGDTFFTSDEMRIIITASGLHIQSKDKMEDDYIQILKDIEDNLLRIIQDKKKTKKQILIELKESTQLIALMNVTLNMARSVKREFKNIDFNEFKQKQLENDESILPWDKEDDEEQGDNPSYDEDDWEEWEE